MRYLSRWLGLAALAACDVAIVKLSTVLIPVADKDGRTAAVVIGVLSLAALGILGLLMEVW